MAYRAGIFDRIYCWLFGGDPEKEPVRPDYSWRCSRSYCKSRLDVRCRGGNCTHHCYLYCNGWTFYPCIAGANSQFEDENEIEEE